MSHRILIATLAIAALVPLAASAEPFKKRDECVEAAVDWTSLPASVPSQLAITPCPECAPMLLEVAATTRFFVGESQVDLRTLNLYARRDGRRTRVCHDPKQKVTRLIVNGRLDAADAAP